jgi:LmbE family N-acetylglucosaminyl deacetylase
VAELFEPPKRGERVVVVSPHLDDGALSLGAAMHSWAVRGARVELLTVLACDARSDAPAGGWDARSGFATEGESARARRDEDLAASAVLGVAPVWLPYGSVDYERHADDETVVEAVVSSIVGAELVLLPGFPLSHPDHRWLVEGVLAREELVRIRHAFYAEQPYAARSGERPSGFDALRSGARDRLAKWRAIRSYRSQLPLLALGELRRGAHVVAWKPELVGPGTLD